MSAPRALQPGCKYRRRNAAAMWIHVHVTTHGDIGPLTGDQRARFDALYDIKAGQ